MWYLQMVRGLLAKQILEKGIDVHSTHPSLVELAWDRKDKAELRKYRMAASKPVAMTDEAIMYSFT